MEINPERPIFKASAETQAIAKLLSTAEIGKTITYQEIIKAAGGDVKQGLEPTLRSKITTARRMLLRHDQIVFHPILGLGLQRSAETDVIVDTRRKVVGIRRRTSRVSRELATVKHIDTLPGDKKQELLVLQAQIGAIKLSVSMPAERVILQKLEQGKQLQIGNVMDLFREKQ
jgi:hypothetical protein